MAQIEEEQYHLLDTIYSLSNGGTTIVFLNVLARESSSSLLNIQKALDFYMRKGFARYQFVDDGGNPDLNGGVLITEDGIRKVKNKSFEPELQIIKVTKDSSV